MKKLSLLVALLLIGLSANALAANPTASATASASAVIVTPIAIAQSGNNLSFGNIVASALGGTVAVDASGSATYSGVSVPSTAGTITAAGFNVTGSDGLTYAITLPGPITLSDGASHSMTVDAFTSNPSATGTLTGGAQTLNVGATLTVGANQVAGTYTGTFSVIVAYN